jgi:hypothetical protein
MNCVAFALTCARHARAGLALALGLGAQAAGAAESASPLAITVKADAGLLEIAHRGRTLLVYAFASNQFKPYVKALHSLAGDDVLRDAPADHLHHHGLMYAIRVNGHNFWEETPTAGHEKSVKLLSQGTGRSAGGLPQATFTQLIHWVAHTNRALADTASAALLLERRTLTLTVDEAAQEVALDWHGEFAVGAAPVQLHGSDYNGLGLRLPQTWDRVAKHQNSENLPYSAAGNRDVIEAKWSAVSHAPEGRAATVALFARPSQTAGTTRFFSMVNPFTYLSVTQGLDQQPLARQPGDKFTLNYRVLVHPAIKSREFLQDRYARWVSGSRGTRASGGPPPRTR